MATTHQPDADASIYVERLRHDRDRFVALAFCAADLLIEADASGTITFVAGATQSLIGSPPDALQGKDFFAMVAPEDIFLVREVLASMTPGTRLDAVPVRLVGSNGLTPPMSLMGYHLPDMPGSHFFAIRLGAPGDRADLDETLERDEESGLLKSDDFAQYVTRQIEDAHERGEDLELTMVHTGDVEALRGRMDAERSRSLMRTLGACLQANSTAGQAAGRIDDSSYGFLHRTGLNVQKVTQRIEGMFRAADPTGVGIEIVSGTVKADLAGGDADDAVRALLYTFGRFCEAKGENFEITSLAENLEKLSGENLAAIAKFRAIVKQGRFEMAFQPIVTLADEKIHHFEALTRFNGKVGDSPYRLITFAENTGVIAEFDLSVCERVLEWLGARAGSGTPPRIAVNVSGRSVGDTEFTAALHALLKRHEAVRSRVIFEVTESARIDDLPMANRFIKGLRDAGHIVCLDDFGAGSAALQYLHALEVDVVKIDGQYVRSAAASSRNRAFLKAVASLCHDLGIATIGEMIEDEKSASMLRECGVRFGQGYYFGRPAFDIDQFDKAQPSPAPVPINRQVKAGSVQQVRQIPGFRN